jgi:16S rRNA (cytosine1402-N4)-methyltransferase
MAVRFVHGARPPVLVCPEAPVALTGMPLPLQSPVVRVRLDRLPRLDPFTESVVSAENPFTSSVHQPVLLAEVLGWLDPQLGSTIVDGTVGAGGHAVELARRVGAEGRVIGLDRDPEMLALAAERTQGLPVMLQKAPYGEIREVLEELGIGRIDGLLLDLGVASDQLAWAQRGFSFSRDGPLDMRFDTSQGPSAADLVNTLRAEELADLFFELGEERFSRRVARRIVEERRLEPIQTTERLAQIVRKSIPGKWGPIDPATRVFQALRIRVNDELDQLDAVLAEVASVLKPGGRVVIISFHSLEDRRVKWAFRKDPDLQVLTPKPVVATAEEIQKNPRARSAKLRAAQRCPIPTGTATSTASSRAPTP